ncbi:di-heme-cytochrome C peroxidase [Hyalangium sp.]|uniref:di-heme-cytochrome C peroxidase n=1 Tax=Hyalangium sp. TaxID=2028555 RepID=UPI002D607388|nr:di-heme-cytochrome C peroxidase [Hyalangium sp.]HYI03015.1 di-heme-cytochrome C peroxidase [Hyalangium sp.]
MRRHPCLVVPLLLLAACATTGEFPPGKPDPLGRAREVLEGFGKRAGLVLETDAYGDGATRLVYLDQGWGPPETLWYYHADQGSVLMPYDTLVHLEQADSDKPFILPEHLTRFRFLPQHKTPNNPDALPVGFARHKDKVGLTCAACHTGQINYRGTAMRIDGAPALIDFVGLLRAMKAALAATLADDAKLARFAAAVPRGGKDSASLEAARQSLTQTLQWFENYDAVNRSTTVEGFGRLDAVGRIINQAIRFTSDPKNSIEPNAPTSFPLLWDAPRHDYVQWTGFSANAGAGSLGRNTGEVVGVFGHVEVKHYETEQEARRGYPSTIETNELVAMEETLRSLQSPQWPEELLPPIDRQRAARGEALYRTHCLSCHASIDRDDPKRSVVAMMTGIDIVGTDETTARNIVEARVPAGVLEGAISLKGEKYGAEVSALALVGDLATRSVSAHPDAALKAVANARLHGQTETARQGNHTKSSDKNPTAELLSYKARPLNGAWASSPYLHNGSVPTLYDLLLPPAERPRVFSVGRWEYDPRKVGYVSDGQVPFVLDTRAVGNSNRGHEYGVTLPEEDRWALVEYLKTL